MKQNHNFQLCLGIDPNPLENSFEKFQVCVKNHIAAIDAVKSILLNKVLKLNLAFFLSYGSKGIALLEQFTNHYKDDFTIILDGKFNEIANSLQAYMNFVFNTLGVHGVTINPFLGEKTLSLAFENCAKYQGEKGRVYVLCVTSESSSSTLSYLQENWQSELQACVKLRNEVYSSQQNLKKCAGVVIGANKENVLFSKEIAQSELSVLAPGLGFQGGHMEVLKNCAQFSNEFTFPMSRSIFEGGNIAKEQILLNLKKIQPYFEENHAKNQ